jgi:hypothetical protein
MADLHPDVLMEEDNPFDMTVVLDDDDDLDNMLGEQPEQDDFNFADAMKVRKNLSEMFDKHVATGGISVAEKIARLEQKSAAVHAGASKLPPRSSGTTGASATTTTSSLSVSLRIRPPVAAASSNQDDPATAAAEVNTIEILPATSHTGRPTTIRTHAPDDSNAAKVVRGNNSNTVLKEFEFPQGVFGPSTTQEQLYATVAAPMVETLVSNPTATEGDRAAASSGVQLGESALLFAYGITNAGKTYTIMGNAVDALSASTTTKSSNEHWGIIPRALQDILTRIEGSDLELRMSYIEIYNENVYDLLPASEPSTSHYSFKPRATLKLGESTDGEVVVRGLARHTIGTVEQGLETAAQAKTKRHTSSNNINADSSRSHCICELELTKKNETEGRSVKLWIVDLAGSERIKRTGTLTGSTRHKEATLINTSLMKLMRCLSVMREKQNHPGTNNQAVVPFRESKLTHLFMSHLTGPSSSKTTMIVNVNPATADFDETQHVLGYAVAAKTIQITQQQSQNDDKKRKKPAYDMNGRKQRSTFGKLVKKLSPKMPTKKRKAGTDGAVMEKQGSSKRTMPPKAPSSTSLVSNLPKAALSSDAEVTALRKEVKNLQASLSIAQAEVEGLRLERDDELAAMEEKVRSEVSDEMEQHFDSTREEYDRIIESLHNQVKKANPVGARSEKKQKMNQAEKMIDELVDKVEECEEEMVRMRGDFEVSLEETKSELVEKHAAEMKALQDSKDEFTHQHQQDMQALQEQLLTIKEEKAEAAVEAENEVEVLDEEAENEEPPKEEAPPPRRLPRSRASKVTREPSVAALTKNNKPVARQPFGSICENNRSSFSEDDDDDDALYYPQRKATMDTDSGTYARPSGRAPRGREWDSDLGAWRLMEC